MLIEVALAVKCQASRCLITVPPPSSRFIALAVRGRRECSDVFSFASAILAPSDSLAACPTAMALGNEGIVRCSVLSSSTCSVEQQISNPMLSTRGSRLTLVVMVLETSWASPVSFASLVTQCHQKSGSPDVWYSSEQSFKVRMDRMHALVYVAVYAML